MSSGAGNSADPALCLIPLSARKLSRVAHFGHSMTFEPLENIFPPVAEAAIATSSDPVGREGLPPDQLPQLGSTNLQEFEDLGGREKF